MGGIGIALRSSESEDFERKKKMGGIVITGGAEVRVVIVMWLWLVAGMFDQGMGFILWRALVRGYYL